MDKLDPYDESFGDPEFVRIILEPIEQDKIKITRTNSKTKEKVEIIEE